VWASDGRGIAKRRLATPHGPQYRVRKHRKILGESGMISGSLTNVVDSTPKKHNQLQLSDEDGIFIDSTPIISLSTQA